MLRFLTQERSSSGLLTRREWLRLGGLTSLGLTGAFSTRALGRQSSSSGTGFGKAQSVVLVYTGGDYVADDWDRKRSTTTCNHPLIAKGLVEGCMEDGFDVAWAKHVLESAVTRMIASPPYSLAAT